MTIIAPPSTHLPPIRRIHEQCLEELSKAVCHLRRIYNPEVRGTRRIVVKKELPSSTAPSRLFSPSTDSAYLENLRSDEFERSHAIRWLTALIAQTHRLETCAGREQECELLVQDAAALLAVCAGAASAGTIMRSFCFTGEDGDISVQLTDVALENQDFDTVGAQTWGSSCLLAEMLADTPAAFGLPPCGVIYPWRALELGAGTGLASITLGKICEARAGCSVASPATVIATDFHLSVLANLTRNIEANFPETGAQAARLSISAASLDWSLISGRTPLASPLDAPFDLILGADIVYEVQHARWIKGAVEHLLRRPEPAEQPPRPEARFHLVIPLRPTHVVECGMVEEVFSPTVAGWANEDPTDDAPADLLVLAILEKTVITCEAYGGVRSRFGSGHSEVEYIHYAIGWTCQ